MCVYIHIVCALATCHTHSGSILSFWTCSNAFCDFYFIKLPLLAWNPRLHSACRALLMAEMVLALCIYTSKYELQKGNKNTLSKKDVWFSIIIKHVSEF